MSSSAHTTRVQRLLVESVLDSTRTLVRAPRTRNDHRVWARELRERANTALHLLEHDGVVHGDHKTIGFEDVAAPYVPDVRDVRGLGIELAEALLADAGVGELAEIVAWIGHCAHLHLVMADLACPDPRP